MKVERKKLKSIRLWNKGNICDTCRYSACPSIKCRLPCRRYSAFLVAHERNPSLTRKGEAGKECMDKRSFYPTNTANLSCNIYVIDLHAWLCFSSTRKRGKLLIQLLSSKIISSKALNSKKWPKILAFLSAF
jgi:hypothetical protein